MCRCRTGSAAALGQVVHTRAIQHLVHADPALSPQQLSTKWSTPERFNTLCSLERVLLMAISGAPAAAARRLRMFGGELRALAAAMVGSRARARAHEARCFEVCAHAPVIRVCACTCNLSVYVCVFECSRGASVFVLVCKCTLTLSSSCLFLVLDLFLVIACS